MSQQSAGAAALSELRELGLTIEIREQTAGRIKAELLQIEGFLLQGAYRGADGGISEEHLCAAYQIIAEQIVDAKTPDDVIEMVIPNLVAEYARRREWAPFVYDFQIIKDWLQGPITEWQGRKLRMQVDTEDDSGKQLRFPRRATWLRQRLKERGWNQNDPIRHNGPDRKTVIKILHGEPVREDMLEKLAHALSSKVTKVLPEDIPSD